MHSVLSCVLHALRVCLFPFDAVGRAARVLIWSGLVWRCAVLCCATHQGGAGDGGLVVRLAVG